MDLRVYWPNGRKGRIIPFRDGFLFMLPERSQDRRPYGEVKRYKASSLEFFYHSLEEGYSHGPVARTIEIVRLLGGVVREVQPKEMPKQEELI